MLTAGDICWKSTPIPPWAPPDRGHFGTPYLDYRDLCIEQLADDLQLMEERAIHAEGALSIEREISRLSIAMLAKVSYQRDQAYARLFPRGHGDEDQRDDETLAEGAA